MGTKKFLGLNQTLCSTEYLSREKPGDWITSNTLVIPAGTVDMSQDITLHVTVNCTEPSITIKERK